MSSLPFDRAASIYDDTRALPEDISERVTQAILDLAPANRPILEAGVGTGRIAVPLLRRGARLIGVDLSAEMMRRLRAKSENAPLARADVSRLPFPDATFGLIVTAHVLHLVGPWREALREFRRALAPGGVYLNSTGRRRTDPPNPMRSRWHALVEAHGCSWRRPGAQDRDEILDELRTMGTRIEEVVVGQWTVTVTPHKELNDITGRIDSDTWGVPDDVLAETVADLHEWAVAEYIDLNAPIPVERRFVFDVIHF